MFGKKKDNIDDFDDPIYDGNLENEIPEETEEAETEEAGDSNHWGTCRK